MGKLIDLTGQQFGRLFVIERVGNYISPQGVKQAQWRCKCKCGNETNVTTAKLRSGHTQSCGCKVVETIAQMNKTYGMSNSRLHYAWGNMKSRCYNPNNRFFKRYGGRGITVCEEWRDSFTAFVDWAMENGYRDNLTIDRIDNNKGYSPNNCRWVTAKVQANNRSTSKVYVIDGTAKSISEWCERYTKKKSTVAYRLNAGWTIEEALELVPRKKTK